MLQFSPQVLTILVLVALALAVLALFLLAAANPRSARRTAPEPDAEARLTEHDRAVAGLGDAIRRLDSEQRRQAEASLGFVQRIGLVRFDAFDDMGGQLSFCAALLDARGDGVVITSINGRQDTRVYAKAVRAGDSHNLSVEEQQAIERAVSEAPRPAPPDADQRPRGVRRVRRGA